MSLYSGFIESCCIPSVFFFVCVKSRYKNKPSTLRMRLYLNVKLLINPAECFSSRMPSMQYCCSGYRGHPILNQKRRGGDSLAFEPYGVCIVCQCLVFCVLLYKIIFLCRQFNFVLAENPDKSLLQSGVHDGTVVFLWNGREVHELLLLHSFDFSELTYLVMYRNSFN